MIAKYHADSCGRGQNRYMSDSRKRVRARPRPRLPARVRARLVEMPPLKIMVSNFFLARTRVRTRVRVRLVETQLYASYIELRGIAALSEIDHCTIKQLLHSKMAEGIIMWGNQKRS